MSSVFIGVITGPGELDNLRELTQQARHFDGLAVTYHGEPEDEEYKLLDAAKGAGFVECIPYVGNHSHSMNHFLYNPVVKMGDWVLLRDSTERVAESFAAGIKPFVARMEQLGISTIYQYSKLLLFRRFPYQFFNGTPHWGFQGAQPNMIAIETAGWFARDEDYAYSTRARRESFHWVNAYLRYYLLPDSNHLLLGKEIPAKAGVTFEMRETKRRAFLAYMGQLLGQAPSAVGLLAHWKVVKLDGDMREFINGEKILSDAYRFNILGDQTVIHSHEWHDMIKLT